MRINTKIGFSLIELLVVISIIGILAAIAIPSYKNYQIQSKVANIIPLVDDLFAKSIIYSEKHGTFPSAADLGIQRPGGTAQDINLSLFPGTNSAYIGRYVNPTGAYSPVDNCGSQGEIVLYYNIGQGNSRKILIVDCYLWHDSANVINKACTYTYTDNNFTNVPMSFPGLVPQYLPTGGPNPEFQDIFTRYTNAVCP